MLKKNQKMKKAITNSQIHKTISCAVENFCLLKLA
ncbi:MAG: hypothetical protein MRECE_4c014 [Mycoplasmataceae bacterium CE_OT135]|nr:MAG: hypothetical protein MRECE_4c014 [Mycoplasmataceae bacterium CE_OT135]